MQGAGTGCGGTAGVIIGLGLMSYRSERSCLEVGLFRLGQISIRDGLKRKKTKKKKIWRREKDGSKLKPYA